MAESNISAKRQANRPPLLIRLLKFLLFRIINTIVIFVIISGGGYLYLKNNPEAKQKLFSTVTSTLQSACQNINNSVVNLGDMNFRNLDLGAMASTFFSDASLEEKQATLQAIGQQVALDNQDLIATQLKEQGVPEGKVEEALAFQSVLQEHDIPLPLGPFLFVIKDSPMAKQYFSGLSKDQVGANGAGAIPLLKRAMDEGTPTLKEAAKQSLMLIGTPEAQTAIRAPKGN